MSSLDRMKHLEAWLKNVSKVETENTSVSLELGDVSAEFINLQTFTESEEEGVFETSGLIENYHMKDSYTVSVVIRNQDISNLKTLQLQLLVWLERQGQKAAMSYDVERNNENSYDYFFDLKLDDDSHDENGQIKSC